MRHMHPIRKAVVIAILLAGLPLVSRVEADFHLVQIDEVMAGLNGDATVQFIELTLLLSLWKQCEQRGMRAQKVILRGPFARPPTPFAPSSAPSRCSCGSHRSTRLPLGSENTPRSSGAASPCGCRALPGCCQRARENCPKRPALPACGPPSGP